MRKTRLITAVALVILVGLSLPLFAQQSTGEGYDIEVYEVTSGLNSFSAVSGTQVTVRVRFTTNSSGSGTCATAVVPNQCASFGFQLAWDPTVLSYNSSQQLSGVPAGWFASVDTTNVGTGQIGMAATGVTAATSPADVLEIVFDVVGAGGSSSSLLFSNIAFGDIGGQPLCGTFSAPGTGSTGSGDYYDEEYDGSVTVVSYGITVSPTSLTIPEGSSDTFSVVLDAAPSLDVTVNLVSNDTNRATVAPASMTFTSGDWNTPQTATVSAVQDSIDNGDSSVTIQNTASSADPNYSAIDPADVAVMVQDDDVRGVTAAPTSLTIAEGGNATFNVVLDTEPTATVTCSVSSSDTGQATVSPTTLTFTTTNWSSSQTVSVSGVDDAVADGDWTGTVDLSCSGGDYASEPASVDVTVTDNDSPGVTVTPTTVNVAEGGATDTYSVVLNTLPTNDVTITITTGGQTTVNPTSLTFTSGNGTTPQTVTVTAVDDAVLEGNHTDTISHTSASADTDYNGATIADVTANITDNEVALWLADGGETPSAATAADDVVVHEEGATSDTFQVQLAAMPNGPVNFTVSSDAQTTVNPTSFALSDAATVATVTVTAVDDAVWEGGPGTYHPSNISVVAASPTDPRFDGATAAVTAQVEDNEEAPAIPSLGGTGLILLIGLLTGLGVAILRMRR